MKIAVGICTYNNEDTIEETLLSILEQERKPDQVIICDKSKDRTLDIIERVSKKYKISLMILLQKGDGVGDARQHIYKNLKDNIDVLATLDTNQVVKRDWLKKIEKGFKDNLGVDLIVSSFPSNQKGTYFEHIGGTRGYFTERNMAIRVKTLKKINGWDPNFLRGEDWDLHIRLWKAGVRSVAIKGINHKMIKKESGKTLKKAIRQPSSLTFLAKYGLWYLSFRSVHVFGDISSVILLILLVLLPETIFIHLISHNPLPLLANMTAVFLNVTLFIVKFSSIYQIRLNLSGISGIIWRQFLNGVSFLCALFRLISRDQRWNMAGFKRES